MVLLMVEAARFFFVSISANSGRIWTIFTPLESWLKSRMRMSRSQGSGTGLKQRQFDFFTEFWDGFEFKFEFSRLNSKAIATGRKGIFAARFGI